jgi:transposase
MAVRTLSIDLAKNLFQLHGEDEHGRVVLKRRLRRDQLGAFVAQLPACVIGVEACAGAFHWARQFEHLGHTVRVISPQFVKPFVRGNKNDGNDAAAICEAVQRPSMRFVPLKSIEQQDVQSLHRARQRLVNHRTALISQMRAMSLDRGIVFGKSASRARRLIPRIVADEEAGLSGLAREMLASLVEFLRQLDERIEDFDRRIGQVFRQSQPCQRIAKVAGVGPKTATALVAAVGDGRDFKNGRHMAAWLGLVPRQATTGGKPRLLGISKRGNRHLRKNLVHGARAALPRLAERDTPLGHWLRALLARQHRNVVVVALANELARICWAVLTGGRDFSERQR